jgi:hypothetical protein
MQPEGGVSWGWDIFPDNPRREIGGRDHQDDHHRDHHRRRLAVSQAAMCAQRARKMYDEAAKERQKAAGGDRKSNGAKSLPANCPEAISKGQARDQVGETLMRRLNAKSGNPRILLWTIVQNKREATPATRWARRSVCLDR